MIDKPQNDHVKQGMVSFSKTPLILRIWFKKLPSTVRYFTFIVMCTAINLSGFLVTQNARSSMFYFDTFGTALASLLGGATAGISVAFATNIIGANMTDAEGYAYFGFANATAALIWAMVPRLGFRRLGSDILHPIATDGYARQLTRIFVLGSLVAIGASLSATIVQVFILGIKLDLGNSSIEAVSGGNYASKNNIVLVAALIQSFNYADIFKNPFFTFFAASLTSNIPDKIMTTASAVIITMAFFRIPRINVQASSI